MWRAMTSSCKFNMDQLIHMVQKTNIRIDAIFESDLKTQQSRDRLSGYQATFDEYASSVKGGNGDKLMVLFMSVRIDSTQSHKPCLV